MTASKMDGKRGRGRPRLTLLDSLAKWLGQDSAVKVIQATKERYMEIMVADALQYDDDNNLKQNKTSLSKSNLSHCYFGISLVS